MRLNAARGSVWAPRVVRPCLAYTSLFLVYIADMDYRDIREYRIQQKAKNVAETPLLILPGDNKLTRRLAKLTFLKDVSDPEKLIGVHVEVIYQKRKNQTEPWPAKTVNLTKVPQNFGFKFALDSIQTYELAQLLQDAYPIGDGAIASGKRTVLRGVGKDELVITEKNKTEALQKLSAVLTSEEINKWVGENIQSISADLAIARIYHERKAVVEEFKKALERDEDENFWQKFLKENDWVFGTGCVEILTDRRLDIHHTTDFPMKTYGGFMDIAEIKRPGLNFWTMTSKGEPYKYREKFLTPNPQLQGAVAQTTKYILQAEKKVNDAEYIKDHDGVVPLKPRGLVVHGRSNKWGAEEWEAFRLLNDELHTVQVITFDHLLKQAEKILAVMQVREENPPLEDVGEINPDDIPF